MVWGAVTKALKWKGAFGLEDCAVGYESEGKIEVNGVPRMSGSALLLLVMRWRRGWGVKEGWMRWLADSSKSNRTFV
jgi:hypothetical protein